MACLWLCSLLTTFWLILASGVFIVKTQMKIVFPSEGGCEV